VLPETAKDTPRGFHAAPMPIQNIVQEPTLTLSVRAKVKLAVATDAKHREPRRNRLHGVAVTHFHQQSDMWPRA
jgi:hypothetical protein